MKKISFAIVAAAAVAAASPASAATNLLTNGSFENGLTGWTQTSAVAPGYSQYGYNQNNGITVTATPGTTKFGNSVSRDNAAGNRSSDAAGNFAAYFVDDQAKQTLSQTVFLTAGTYDVGFDYYQVVTGNAGPFTLDVAFGNKGIATASSASTSPAGSWYNTSSSFVAATSGNYTFNFTYTSGTAPAADALVDRVYVAAVPEPATWGMMVLGFGAVGFAARRRAKVSGRVVAA